MLPIACRALVDFTAAKSESMVRILCAVRAMCALEGPSPRFQTEPQVLRALQASSALKARQTCRTARLELSTRIMLLETAQIALQVCLYVESVVK